MNMRIIIAAAQTEALARLEQALVVRGFDVERARDGWAAMRTVLASLPAMVLVEMEEPFANARAFGEVLKRNPRTAEVLLFAISSAEAPRQKPAFLDGWIQTPFNADEVAAYLIRSLGEKRKKQGKREEVSDLAGDLSQVSPIDLLQMLCAKQSTGILELDMPKCRGAIYMRDGNIIDAEHGKTLGVKALYRIMGATEGSFAFHLTDPARSAQIFGRTDNLLMEGMRQHDELNRFLDNVLSLDDVLEFVPTEVEEQRPALEVEVAGLIQRYRCMADVLEHASSTDLETAQVVADLMDKGQVFAVGTKGGARFVPAEMLGRLCQAVESLRRPGMTGPARLAWFFADERTASQFSAALSLGVDGYSTLSRSHESLGGLPAAMGRLNLGQDRTLEMTALPIQAEMAPMWQPFLVVAVGVGIVVPDSRSFRQAAKARALLARSALPFVCAASDFADLEEPGLIRADPLTPDGAFQVVSGLVQEIVKLGEEGWEGKNRTGR